MKRDGTSKHNLPFSGEWNVPPAATEGQGINGLVASGTTQVCGHARNPYCRQNTEVKMKQRVYHRKLPEPINPEIATIVKGLLTVVSGPSSRGSNVLIGIHWTNNSYL